MAVAPRLLFSCVYNNPNCSFYLYISLFLYSMRIATTVMLSPEQRLSLVTIRRKPITQGPYQQNELAADSTAHHSISARRCIPNMPTTVMFTLYNPANTHKPFPTYPLRRKLQQRLRSASPVKSEIQRISIAFPDKVPHIPDPVRSSNQRLACEQRKLRTTRGEQRGCTKGRSPR